MEVVYIGELCDAKYYISVTGLNDMFNDISTLESELVNVGVDKDILWGIKKKYLLLHRLDREVEDKTYYMSRLVNSQKEYLKELKQFHKILIGV